MSELPLGWAWATLGEICDRAAKWDPRGAPEAVFDYIDIGSIEDQRVNGSKRLVGADAPSRARQLVRAGDTILSTVRTYLVNTALVPNEFDGATVSTGFCVLRPRLAIDPRFLFYRVITTDVVNALSALQTGSSYPAVRDSDVFAQAIALPPLAEQRRIVAAIDEQLSRLDAATAFLAAAGARAQRLKEAVLEQVFGEPWPRRTIGEVATLTDGPFGSNLKTSHYVDAGPRVVRLQNIGDGVFRDERAHITWEHYETLKKHAVEPGDVVAASLGEEAPRACLIPESLGPAIVKADCIRIRPTGDIDAGYLMWALNSRPLKAQAAARIKGIGRPRLGLGGLRQLDVPVPPPEIQRQSAEAIDRVQQSVAAIKSRIDSTSLRGTNLRRSLLTTAVGGQLVSQDPDDEPASVLLEQIAAERQAAPKPARNRAEKATA